MKRLIIFLCSISLICSSFFSVISCGCFYEKVKLLNSKYIDGELNNIPQIYRDYVRYTSPIAKILISSRHENLNTYAMPVLQYFLNNIGQNNEGTFKTKSGENVIIKPYIDKYKKMNNFDWEMVKAHDKFYDGGKNLYQTMSCFVQMNDFSKLNNKENNSHPLSAKDFNVNSNTAWAQYDTGAMVNILSQHSKSVIDYVNSIDNSWYWNYFFYPGNFTQRNAGVSNIIFDNFIKSQPVNNGSLSFFDIKNNENKVQYGSAIADHVISLYKLYGIKYFNLAATSLKFFQHGLEFQTLGALSQLIPIVPNNNYSNGTLKVLLSLPFVVLSFVLNGSMSWFKVDGEPTSDSPLRKIFKDDTLKNLKIKHKNFTGFLIEENLCDLLRRAARLGTQNLTNHTNRNSYLDITVPGHENDIFEMYAILDYWFKMAIKSENFDVDKFNKIISSALYKLFNHVRSQIKSFPIASDSAALIWAIQEMFNSPNFDLYNLLRGIGGFANWFYEFKDNNFVPNINNVKNVVDIFDSSTEKMAGFDLDITNVDQKSEYGKFVLKKYGYDFKNDRFISGSFFDMLNIWARGNGGINSDHQSMYRFLNNTINSNSGYIGKIYEDVQRTMAEYWFDNVFLNKNWYITGKGKGVDNSNLGIVTNKNQKIVSVRYQLDYFGPKDSSTNLKYHMRPIRYLNPLTGKRENGEVPKHSVDGYNLPPINECWNYDDWKSYDGDGEHYISNSDKIKYSYVVEFVNEARALYGYSRKDDSDENNNSFKLSDFKWYYNGKQYF